MGNLQVRFLEGWAPAMAPGHSTLTGLIEGLDVHEKQIELVRMMHSADVPIMAGSDFSDWAMVPASICTMNSPCWCKRVSLHWRLCKPRRSTLPTSAGRQTPPVHSKP